MRRFIPYYIIGLVLTLAGCGRNSTVRQLPHLGDTPYQQDSILVAYATNPERALMLLDSAWSLGNVSDYRAQFIRAKIYSKSLTEQRLDSAISICKALLSHDSVRNEPAEQENILDMLIAASRIRRDNEQYLQWATQKAELCRQQDQKTERWRTEADIGLLMTFLGQVDEGLAKLDEAISQLDAPGSIDRMDAFIVAVKRKINALDDLQRHADIIPLAQRILDRLDHYEQHAGDYAEDSSRLSWSDNPSDRDRYLDFSRAQANGFLAVAYARTGDEAKARECLALFDQSDYGRTFMARRMIIPAQMALGMYDEAMATSDEIVRRMGPDTLNADYAVILRDRAIAARAKGRSGEAYDLMNRYAVLNQVVSDSLHASEAHDYAARYHAKEQELKIQEAESVSRIKSIVIGAVALLLVIAVAVLLYYHHQKKIISEKNRALVRIINGLPPEMPDDDDDLSPEDDADDTSVDDESLFPVIDATIRTERLYANQHLQRQDVCDRCGISRHQLNSLMVRHTGGLSFPQYVNAIRLQEALELLRDKPDMTNTAIAAAVGFTLSNFRQQFKKKYGMTPQEYRQNM